MKGPAAFFVLVWLTAGSTSVLATPLNCSESMRAYHEKYEDHARNEKSTYPEQLAYLESIASQSCRLDASYHITKTELLVFLHRFDEALQCIDDADKMRLKPRANVLEKKATTLLVLRKYDVVKITQSLDDIGALYKEALDIEAKEGDPSRFPMYYAGLAEVAYQKGELDDAAKLISIAIEIGDDLPSQYFSFSAVIASKQKRWNDTVRFVEMSINKNKNNYLSEDETIRAMAEAFCHLGRNDLAAKAISLATTENPILAQAPDVQAAQETVKNCPVAINIPSKNTPHQ